MYFLSSFCRALSDRLKRLSLLHQVALSFLMITGLILALVLWQTDQDTYELLIGMGTGQARVFLAGVEREVQWHAPDLDRPTLQEIVKQVSTFEPENLDFRIEHLFILDRNGIVIAANQPEHLGADLSREAYLMNAMRNDTVSSPNALTLYTVQDDPSVTRQALDVALPLHLRSGAPPVGAIEVELDVTDSVRILKSRYWSIRRDLFVKLALLTGALSIATLFAVRYQVIARLREMAFVATTIARGDRNARVRPMGGDEIGALADAFNRMTDSLQRTIEDLKRTEITAMTKLAELAEKRDPDTGAHLLRIPRYCEVLARELRRDSPYRDVLDDQYIQALLEASVLHDIGKVGTPDAVLFKPSRLTPEEFAIIRAHPVVGADVLSGADFLSLARDIALGHHEWYDGSGYPNGYRGNEIPLAARIVALADMYDALTTQRVYKEAFSHEEAFALIREPVSHETASALLESESGRHFDPYVMRAFLRCADQFRAIRDELAD